MRLPGWRVPLKVWLPILSGAVLAILTHRPAGSLMIGLFLGATLFAVDTGRHALGERNALKVLAAVALWIACSVLAYILIPQQFPPGHRPP